MTQFAHTEDEARKRWCPYAMVPTLNNETRQIDVGSIVSNRTGKDVPVGSCVGSHCMAWRWLMVTSSALGASVNADGSLRWPAELLKAGASVLEVKLVDPRGYCGLAGNP